MRGAYNPPFPIPASQVFPMRFLIAVLVSLFSLSALAQTVPPPLAAKAWAPGRPCHRADVAEKDADARIEPASLTKLMTAYITFPSSRKARSSPTRWCRSTKGLADGRLAHVHRAQQAGPVWMSSSAA